MLLQSGMSERWWPLAVRCWAVCYNATYRDKEGLTPWHKRYGSGAPFRVYPFGSLVLFKPAKGSTVTKAVS